MKIAIFSPFATVIPHFETELELAQRHLDSGDSVDMPSCYGDLDNCDFNIAGSETRCNDCVGRRTAGFSLLSKPVSHLPIVTSGCPDTDAQVLQLQTEFESVDQLIHYQYGSFDIGYAALSSLVSSCRDPEPDLVEHGETLRKIIRSAWKSYTYTLEYIDQNQPDRIYVFNGRFASMRAVLRACQLRGVDCMLHERGCDNQHYDLFKNHLPHDISALDQIIRDAWRRAGDDRTTIGESWYLDRVNRIERNWHSFVKAQKQGRLPENWDDSKRNISIFCSSDDEFVSIGDEWKNSLYLTQCDAIRKIARDLLELQPQTSLFVRLHPNQKDVDNKRKSELLALSSPNLTIIKPEESIDTYSMLHSSATVASFGSAVGIESVFWGKPSVLLGPALYEHLGGLYKPKSHRETLELLGDDLKPLEKTGALMYGHWFQTRGQEYVDYKATGFFEGTFKGQLIYAGMKKPKKKIFRTRELKKRAKSLFKTISGRV